MLDNDPYAAYLTPPDASDAAPVSTQAASAQPTDVDAAAARNARYQQIANTQGADGVIAALKAEGVDPASIDENAIRLGIAAHAPVSTIGVPPAASTVAPAAGPAEADPYAAFLAPPARQPTLYDGTGGALARGAEDGITLGLAPRLNAIGDVINHATGGLTGEDTGKASYSDNLDLERQRQSSDEEHHQAARLAGQLIGGLALPTGMEGVAFTAGKDALRGGATLAEARIIAIKAATARAATVGSAYGAGYGLNSSYGSAGERLASTAAGAGEGALGGLVFGKAAEYLAPGQDAARVASRALPVSDSVALSQAADRQGITPFAPDVGGTTVRRLAAGVAQTPFGAPPIIKAAQDVSDQVAARRDAIAASIGQALRPEAAGQSARSGALAYIKNSGAAAGAMYNAAAKAAGDTRVDPKEAIANLDQHILELSGTPGGSPGLATLQGLRDELSKGPVTVQGMRNMRTVLRDQFVKDGLTGSDLERRVGQVLDAATTDVRTGLNDAGKPEAAALYARADAAWKERANTIKTVIKPLIGTPENPRSGEQVIKTLTADLQGNNARAVKFINALPADEQANTRASIIGALGRQTAGAQNADGDGFSLGKFLTHWNEIGESAKHAYFGAESRAALNDLARVAQGSKEAQSFANRSNTGGALEANKLITAVTALPTAGGLIAGQYGLGRLLASPRFARWLARAPKTSLSMPAYADRLSRIAVAEPAIAQDLLGLQARLTKATPALQPSLAADKGDQKSDGVNR